jgi:HD-like signal output (HDOD) protein
MKKIIYLDDDKEYLSRLETFLGYKEELSFTLASTKEKLDELLSNDKWDMVIVNSNLSGQDGTLFLRDIKEKYEYIIRVVTSTNSESYSIRKALSTGWAELVIKKPWSVEEFTNIVINVFSTMDTIIDPIKDYLSTLESLPTIPSLYTKLIKMIEGDDSVIKIGRVIEEDQVISSRILKLANSAFYAANTGSISNAIMYIGLNNTKNIVLTNSMFNNLNKYDKVFFSYLWNHVNLTNKILVAIYERLLFKKLPDYYSSAGLLHDIGRVIIASFSQKEYSEFLKNLLKKEFSDYIALENEYFNISHSTVGAYFLHLWGIPFPIVESALFHHDPLNERIINKDLVCYVHIANYYSKEILGKNYENTPLIENVFDDLDISKEEVEEMVKVLKIEMFS